MARIFSFLDSTRVALYDSQFKIIRIILKWVSLHPFDQPGNTLHSLKRFDSSRRVSEVSLCSGIEIR